MGRRHKGDDSVCIAGYPIAHELKPERAEWMRAGPCQACAVAPLHATTTHHRDQCSFVRNYRRLCRACAIAYDYVVQGFSRIDPVPFTPTEWGRFVDTYMRGQRAVWAVAP